MDNKIEIVKRYFESWMNKDFTIFEEIFSEKAIYIECYGPAYQGLEQIKKWFCDWNKKGTVLVWDIKKYIVNDKTVVCEWYFQCKYNGVEDGFNGVSWIIFDENNKITELNEYQSKVPIHFPYNIKISNGE